MELEQFMRIAIREAEASMCEGNRGFGAVVVRDGAVLASAHDTEDTTQDPTSHAEMNAIRQAARITGKKLTGCLLVSTHEPCPMCASAIVWAGISAVAWGISIQDALAQGRTRIGMPCAELFARAGADIRIYQGILKEECSVLYREDVRREIARLRDADDGALDALNAESARKRSEWFAQNTSDFDFITADPLDSAYRLLLRRLGITPGQAPVVKKDAHEIVFHSMNFCPTLEACKILGLDTRHVCRRLNERSTDALVKQVDSRLCFARNYDKLRPLSPYCEEMIRLPQE